MTEGPPVEYPYHNYGLLIGTYAARNHEKGFAQCDELVRQQLQEFRGNLTEIFSSRQTRSTVVDGCHGNSLTTTSFPDHFYNPASFVCFGRRDFTFITLVDDFEAVADVTNLVSASLQKFHHGTMLNLTQSESPTELLCEPDAVSEAIHSARCIAVSQLKVHVLLLSVFGRHVYDFVCRMSSDILKQLRDERTVGEVKTVIAEAGAWHDLILIVTGDSFEDLGKVVVGLRERRFADLWERIQNQKERYLIKGYLTRSFQQSTLGKKAPKGKPIPEDNHIFLTSSTTLGYNYCAHDDLVNMADKMDECSSEDLDIIPGTNKHRWGRVVPLAQFAVKPGHIQRVCDTMEKMDHIADSNGDSSLVPVFFSDPDALLDPQKRSSFFVDAADYAVWCIRVRKELRNNQRELVRGEFLKVGPTPDYYDFRAEMAVPVPRGLFPAAGDEVISIVESLLPEVKPNPEITALSVELRNTVGLSVSHIRAVREVLRTYDSLSHDPFTFDSMFEVGDYLDSMKQYLEDCMSDDEADCVRLADQVTQAVHVFERAFLHRFRSGYRMADMSDYNIEYKGGVNRMLTAIDALLNDMLGIVVRVDSLPKETKRGGIAVPSPDPRPHVFHLMGRNSRCMAVFANELSFLRPERLSMLFHEAGHLLWFRRAFKDWLQSNEGKECGRKYQQHYGVSRPFRALNLYLEETGDEITSNMFLLVFGCLTDPTVFSKLFFAELSVDPASYGKRPIRYRNEERRQMLVQQSVIYCAIMRVASSTLRTAWPKWGKQMPSPWSDRAVASLLRNSQAYSPELSSILGACSVEGVNPGDEFLRQIVSEANFLHECMGQYLGTWWRKMLNTYRDMNLDKITGDIAEEWIQQLNKGRIVVSDDVPQVPVSLFKVFVERTFSLLQESDVLLPRALDTRRPDFSQIKGGEVPKVFLDRHFGYTYYCEPNIRRDYFRRRAALIGSLWHYALLRHQGRLAAILVKEQDLHA